MNSANTKVPHVCIIGAGVCGLVSVKACLEAGFQVTCFDKSAQYGGLWCYRPDNGQNTGPFEPSVMRTTILNTSKELSAFSDLPPPAQLPNFMRHNLYMDYIRSYVEHFKLMSHLRLEHEILRCEPEFDHESNQIKWSLEIKDLKHGGESFIRKFDKLMIAIGHHNVPFNPSFTNQHKFKGQIIHSARVKDILQDKRFIDKRVLVIGLGNSACDAASDLAIVAQKCYVSCHRGNWFVNRVASDGFYDFKAKSRWFSVVSKIMPTSVIDKLTINKLETRTNHKMLGLKPKHKPSEQVPTINDLLPYRIATGGVILKGAISSFTETGVKFEGEEDVEHPIDVVILATGYMARVPFLKEYELGLKSAEHSDEYELYLNMFAPRLTIPGLIMASDKQSAATLTNEAIRTLAFIGLVQPSGSITVVSELQARFVALVFAGKLELPPVPKMLKHIDKVRRQQSRAIRSHSRDQLVGNWVGYLDLVAKGMGVKPNLLGMFFKDFALWRRLVFGPSVPYQYRLSGPGEWPMAREMIMGLEERVYQGINEGKNHILFGSRRKCLTDNRKPPVQTTAPVAAETATAPVAVANGLANNKKAR